MKRTFINITKVFALTSIIFTSDILAHLFNCQIDNISMGAGCGNLIYVTMDCPAVDPIQSGTNGCTATNISQNTVAFDRTSDLGKSYYPLLMAAMMAQKQTLISAYATCPSNSPSTPVIYSIRVHG